MPAVQELLVIFVSDLKWNMQNVSSILNPSFKHISYIFIFYLHLITLCYILQSNSFASCPVMPLIYTVFNTRYLPALQVSEEEGLLQTASGAPLLQRNGKKWLCHWWLQVSMVCGEHRGDWLTVSHSQHPPHLFRHLQGQDSHKHMSTFSTCCVQFYSAALLDDSAVHFRPRVSISCTTSFQTGSMWMQLKHQSEVIFIRYGLL